MLRKPSPVFNRLLDRISEIPVVDCHDHLRGPDRDLEDAYTEPILALTVPLYLISDLWSAGASDEEIELLQSEDATTDEKWPIFSRLWAATEHTAFARVTKLMLREAYGIETLTRQSLDRIVEQRTSYDRSHYMKVIRDAGIKAVIADVIFALSPPPWGRPIRYFRSPVLREFLEGRFPMPDMWHPAFPLPYFHEIRHREFIDFVGVMSNSNITSLDEFEEAMFEVVKRSVDLGVIAFKDQSAYCRVISYDLPARGDAERIFNKLLIDPRNQLAWPDAKPLDDYLFHQYMRFARELHLPVQVHTGYMAGIRNRVDKANAANFASVLELHTAVQFDLFHGNWPYMGDVLFLGKNYPNVTLDFCWVQMMDPLYAQELLKRAVMTVPHAKIHGFGGDYFLEPEPVAAHLTLAREVFAGALADLVECGWLGEEKAVHLAADWLFNNPNRFYNLGLEPYDGC